MLLHWLCVLAFTFCGTDPIQHLTSPSLVVIPLSDVLFAEPTSNKKSRDTEVKTYQLTEGRYHGNEIRVISRNLKIEGHQTTIVHTNQLFPSPTHRMNQMDSLLKDDNPHEAIFTVFNSSLRFERLSVSVSHARSVCFLADSDLELSSCSILSSAECPPFVVSRGFGTRPSTVQILSSSHESSDSNLLSPLVGFGKTDSDLVSSSIGIPSPKSKYLCSISVVGHSVSFSSTSLVGRSGPLLEMDQKLQNEFASADCQPSEEICSTALISSSFVNVSSLSLGSRSRTNQPQLTQKVIGCLMLRSTDHFSGTAIRSMNMGGNVLCSNSSFAHCSSASNKDITEGGRIVYNHTTTSTLKYTSCTFRHMTCKSTDQVGGAAIAVDGTLAYVTIDQCAFHNCSATDESADGGAVSFMGVGENSPTSSTAAVSQSSFTACSAEDAAGGLAVYYVKSLTVTTSSFQGNRATRGGALSHHNLISSSITNTSFVDNQASQGGAVHFNNKISFVFTDTLFRDNVATEQSNGSDISFAYLPSSGLPQANFTRCDSSSAIPTIGTVYSSSAIPTIVHQRPIALF
ncbi:hypothetical protein BLNAU_23561 [Blattamonas nauphoetae]|uniref:Right handed beta helix domain-containing protein n=1 Tax=Blattamonas nauphoetae TaxID=2049346 RepID=A0ABQ9WPV8_9EUKA|nr:hypothetical protein BLNAU_23561 [Blattamonas nauphoetae]